MSDDKIKAAARRRMAQTGEPYATARAAAIKMRKAPKRRRSIPDMSELIAEMPDVGELAGQFPDVHKLAGRFPDVHKPVSQFPDVNKLVSEMPETYC